MKKVGGDTKRRKVDDDDDDSNSSASSSDSSSEAELSDAKEEKVVTKKTTTTNRKRKGVVVEEEDDPELVGLTELERENILFERDEAERKRKAEENFLKAQQEQKKAMKKTRHGKSGGLASSSSEEEESSESESSSSEEDIKPKSKKKVAPTKKNNKVSESSSESEEEPSDEEDEEDDIDKQDPKFQSEATLKDFIAMQLTRTVLVQWEPEPYFQSCVGGYVRLHIGASTSTGEQIYRICRIEDIEEVPTYPVDNSRVDHALILKHGKNEGRWNLDQISNSTFLQVELDFYKKNIAERGSRIKMPTKRDVKKFESRIREEVLDYKITHDDLKKKIQRNRQKRSQPAANLSSEKTELLRRLTLAKKNMEHELVRELEIKLDEVDDAIKKRKERISTSHAASANINERNTKENMFRVMEKSEKNGKNEWNPFARKPTQPVILWSTLAPGQSSDNIDVTGDKDTKTKSSAARQKSPSKIKTSKVKVVADTQSIPGENAPDTSVSTSGSAANKPKKQWTIARPKPTGAKKMSLAEYMQKMSQQDPEE